LPKLHFVEQRYAGFTVTDRLDQEVFVCAPADDAVLPLPRGIGARRYAG
jgi:hypothetical protein